ncbi:hypothetical protein HO133_002262 [Letharia lupina]|uniref:LisH domain-containing protein n=1 Tax=Letharia lupina TaxID=560253 RepID=A0A8H6FAK6_9LECA|nr:uncharacterized protein HO133_002262 [Letharia lupina]KAF6221407.1 hypothetical protein HO133_002262 [Letharia lupina]
MAAGTLTSDHVNYLIWRYLQESGHGDAAVKLQRDWLLDPQTLPFAQHIKTHALVSLVQKGLQYHQIEQSLDQPGGRKSSSAATLLFFGTEAGRASSIAQQEQIEDERARSSSARKHGRDSNTNGLSLDLPPPAPAAKRSRRSNGDISTNGDRGDGDSMQTDQNGYHYQSEAPVPVSPTNYSPAEDGPTANGIDMDMDMDEDADAPGSPASDNAPLVQTLTNGESRGVQSDKVAELGPQTSILTVSETSHVMHTAWNPKDPTILATSGEALCRLWYISRSAAFDDSPNHQSYVDLFDSSHRSFVSTMAWDPTGEILAVATRDDNSVWVGAVSLWSKAGKALDELPAVQDLVLRLRWSPSGKQLLGITSSGDATSSLALWDVDSSQSMPPYQLPSVITDAAWTSNHQITICGNNIIASSLLEDQRIIALNTRSEPTAQHDWFHIRYDSRTHTTALAAEDTPVLGLIDPSDTLHTITAHESEITALAYQPVTNLSAYPASAPRLLATSSLDGSIKVWDAKRPFDLVHTLSLGHAAPAIAMSFTPDGYLVAAANWNRVLIWNAEAGGLPKATWKGVLGKFPNGMLTNGNGASEEEDDFGGDANSSLSWDAESGKLALGIGNKVAIINFRH